jgi:hypothetical protein
MINKHLEILEYRKFKVSDSEAEVEIPILTLKTGTALFRGVLDPSKFISDFLGIPIEGKPNSYCLPSQYNTFFFSYPYVFDTNYYNKLDAKGKNSHTALYVLTHDVKVALMIKPSKIIRANKDEPNAISESCDHYTFCDGLKGRSYDPCFTEEFMKANPDVLGMYAIQKKDNVSFLKTYNKDTRFKPFKKFVSFLYDDYMMGAPELILYPRRKRVFEDVKVDLNELGVTFEEYMKEHYEEFNYYSLDVYKHDPLQKDEMYYKLLKMLNPKGMFIDDQNFHLTIDKRTYFYVIYESYSKEDRKYLVPIKEEQKLNIFKKKDFDLIFSLGYLK